MLLLGHPQNFGFGPFHSLFVRGTDGLHILDLLSDPDGATKGLVKRACASGKLHMELLVIAPSQIGNL